MKVVTVDEKGRRRVATENMDKSKTDQSWKDDCDVNHIMKRFMGSAVPISHVNRRQGYFADVSEISDLHTSLIQVEQAKAAFYAIPADIRAKFGNDMRKYVEFMNDPANDQECIDLGLKVGPEVVDKPPKEVTDVKAKEPAAPAAEGTGGDNP